MRRCSRRGPCLGPWQRASNAWYKSYQQCMSVQAGGCDVNGYSGHSSRAAELLQTQLLWLTQPETRASLRVACRAIEQLPSQRQSRDECTATSGARKSFRRPMPNRATLPLRARMMTPGQHPAPNSYLHEAGMLLEAARLKSLLIYPE